MNRRTLFALIGSAPLWMAARESWAEAGFAAEEYWLLPLRVHLLRSKTAPDLDCKLQLADVERITGKINGIWKQAGIQFFLESVLSEEAASAELYEGLGENRTDAHLLLVRPRESHSNEVVHVYCVHAMRPNGICFGPGSDRIFVKDTSVLRRVEGGIDEFLPRVSAHEIGHALGLPHRQDTVNLMASGTTGTSLNEAEIGIARKTAEGFSFHLKPAEALAKAEQQERDGAHGQAAALYTALAALPESPFTRAAKLQLQKPRNGG